VSRTITIADYGVGNLFSVRSALEHCGATPVMATTYEEVLAADRLLLPGVGAFGDAMEGMRRTGMLDAVSDFAAKERPLLGICLGMQMLLSDSVEFGMNQGLGLIPGHVVSIPDTGIDGIPHRIPHAGWGPIFSSGTNTDWGSSLLEGIAQNTAFYFVHSFHSVTDDPSHLIANCDYDGQAIGAVVQNGSVFGCQFHPEKSAEAGLSVIKNFLSL
jgi:glutamine amidotransferase